MPGICGIATVTSPAQLGVVADRMCAFLATAPWHKGRTFIDAAGRYAVGSVTLDFLDDATKTAHDPGSGDRLWLDGELYDVRRLATALKRPGEEVQESNHAALLLKGYQRRGTAFFRDLHGSFAAALWIEQSQELILINDQFGSRPLYYLQDGDGFRFGSNIAALLAESSHSREVNPRGLAQFFSFGHYLRDDTMLAGVRVLPAAACFVYSLRRADLKQDCYWNQNESNGYGDLSDQEWLERIDDALVKSTRRRADAGLQLGLSLSGGLDARTLLGVLDTSQTAVRTVCMGVEGSLDHRSAAELARLAGCSHQTHVLDQQFLGNFPQHLESMVRLTDGQYLSQCIVIPTLPTYRELGIQSLIRGHAGELMHMRKAYNYSLDESALAIRSTAELRTWLLQRLCSYLMQGVTQPLFAGPYQESFDRLAQESLDEDLQDVHHISRPLDRIWPLFVNQRLRRETVISMMKFRTIVEPRLPFIDNDLIPLLLAAPARLKLGDEIQTHILRRHRPAFLRVTNANTGAPMGAGPARQKLATLQMKVLAKLGVKGYQPYEKLGLWLRQELAPLVKEILLSEQTLDRGVFAPDGIRSVVQRHLYENKNHTYLLMALMIFELGLRHLVDGRTNASLSDNYERNQRAKPVLAFADAGTDSKYE